MTRSTTPTHPVAEPPGAAVVWQREMITPIGRLTVVASERGVRAVLWPKEDPSRVRVDARADVPETPAVARVLDAALAQLGEYFAGTRTEFDVPLDPIGTPFQMEAWRALCTIPYGQTVSYGEQARRIGDPRKARAIGAANGRNPISIIVPCHRVIGADGSLTGFAGGIQVKAWLLDHERGALFPGA